MSRGRPSSQIDWQAVWLTAANVHDSVIVEDAMEPIKRPRGRPRMLHAARAYDYGSKRAALPGSSRHGHA